MNQGNKRTSREKKVLSHLKAFSGRNDFIRRVFGSFGLFSLCLLLSACPSNPPVNQDTGSLQVFISGLPPEAEANVTVTGPDNYTAEVEGSRTLTGLATGRYTVSVDSVTYASETYPGSLPGSRASAELEVAQDALSEVTVAYSSVGVVEAGEIAPGVTRSGMLSPGTVDDYTFSGTEGVPLAFSFAGTKEESSATYEVSIFQADDLATPLYAERYGTSNSYPYKSNNPVVGFTPPANGDYVLRVGTQRSELRYTVKGSYLSGTLDERRTPTRLAAGELVLGAVTAGSVDRYLFSATTAEAVTLMFDYEEGAAIYLVEILPEGSAEVLFSERVGTANNMRELTFTPPATGDYLLRVAGQDSVLRYSLGLEK